MSDTDRQRAFAAESSQPRRSLLSEVWMFLAENKKWWMAPIVVVFVLFGILMLVGGTAAAPFIYSLF